MNPEQIKLRFAQLDPSRKRLVAIVAAAGALLGLVALTSMEEEEVVKKKQETIKTVFTEQNTRSIGMDALSAQAKTLNRENNRLRSRMGDLENSMKDIADVIAESKNFDDRLAILQKKVSSLQTENLQLKSLAQSNRDEIPAAISKALAGMPEGTASQPGASGNPRPPVQRKEVSDAEAKKIFEEAGLPGEEEDPDPDAPRGVAGGRKNANPSELTQTIAIKTYSGQAPESDSRSANNQQPDPVYMPAGSILTGVLINGMDAPTSSAAKKNPFPSTIRIQKEAILPNRYTADVRECFLVVSGYGDLSSERVYLRGESLSCITEDQSVIEARLESYAIGEDGKAGVRGRVVDKQGQIIARSLMAGFAGSLSETFNANPVPTLSTTAGSATPYQSVYSGQALQSGLAKGTGRALDRIAQFYIEMAENIFPVVEVDAGREVEIVLTRGATLNVKSSKAKQPTTKEVR